MAANNPNKITLKLLNGKLTNELYKFLSISLDVEDLNLDDESKSKIINKLRKEANISDSNTNINELFEIAIDAKYPQIHSNLLFHKNISNIKLNYIMNCKYNRIPLGDMLLAFLNLDFNKFDDFFRFYCTFIFMYIDKIPENDFEKIFNYAKLNNRAIIFSNDNNVINIDYLKDYAKTIHEDEKNYLIEKQQLFKDFVDYVFNNNKENKIKKLKPSQRFYIYQKSNETISDLSKNYICNYDLGFHFNGDNFKDELMNLIKEDKQHLLSDEQYLIDIISKDDSTGSKMLKSSCLFETNDLFTYFYIVFYHIVAEEKEFIKKCLVCGKYFFTNKDTTLYCNNKYTKDLTCKEFGIKTSQKRKENEEPIYGKYRQIYAKKAMMVKRNPDIPSYKTNYEKWKKEAKQFINDIKNGTKSYEEFDEWLKK